MPCVSCVCWGVYVVVCLRNHAKKERIQILGLEIHKGSADDDERRSKREKMEFMIFHFPRHKVILSYVSCGRTERAVYVLYTTDKSPALLCNYLDLHLDFFWI